jgi:hypothetical protein
MSVFWNLLDSDQNLEFLSGQFEKLPLADLREKEMELYHPKDNWLAAKAGRDKEMLLALEMDSQEVRHYEQTERQKILLSRKPN